MAKQVIHNPIIQDKRNQEKKILNLMIKIYCNGHKHISEGICHECENLMDYSNRRVDNCPFMETKTFCQSCSVHCYKMDMRLKIKEVMRYSGPRMLIHHPILTIRHMIDEHMDKKRRKL